jgi:hypothetical protein
MSQPYALDLTRHHWRHRHGDITAYGTWWLGEDSGPKPCVVLVPTYRRMSEVAPCVVLMEQAWVWSETAGDPVHAAKVAMAFVDALGLSPTPQSCFRVRGIIIDHLDELCMMPPMPDAMREFVTIGEAKVTNREAGTVVRHEEVIDRV